MWQNVAYAVAHATANVSTTNDDVTTVTYPELKKILGERGKMEV